MAKKTVTARPAKPRSAAKAATKGARPTKGARTADPMEVARRGHLRVLRSPDS